MTTKKKPKPITKEDLNRALDRLTEDVEEKSEVWLGVLMELIPLCIKEDKELAEGDIVRASLLSDVVLREYEQRWFPPGVDPPRGL